MNQETVSAPVFPPLPVAGATLRHDLIAALAARDLALAEAARKHDSLAADLARARRDLDARTEDVGALTRDRHADRTRLEQSLAREQALRADLVAREMALADARRQLTTQTDRADQMKARADAAAQDLAALTRLLDSETARCSALEKQIATLRREGEKATGRMRSAERQLRNLKASTSWRITAPLRWIVLRLRPAR